MTVSSYPLAVLLLPTLLIFLVGFVVSLKVCRTFHWALFIAFVKTTLFLIYYSLFFDGTFTFVDDWTYIKYGVELQSNGVSIINIFSHLPELFSYAGGKHFLYYLYNADAFRLLGSGYFSPVALNIVLTFFAAAFMVAAVRRGLDFKPALAKGLFIYMALHPDIVAWSTIINGKDIVLFTGTGLAVYTVSLFADSRYILGIFLATLTGLVLFFTRFYVPLMLLLAVLVTLMFSPLGRKRPGLWMLVPTGLVSVVCVLGLAGLQGAVEQFQEGFVNPIYGVPRILLTPIPFHTTESYTFLNLPQAFHWIMLPALLYGVFRIWRQATFTGRFAVIYFVIMLLLYGMFESLQGPRHRVQLDGLIALFQFYGSVGILRQLLPKARPASAASIPQHLLQHS